MNRASDTTSMVDAAYQRMRRHILDNMWPPGHQALEQEVALSLGISRTPVRGALIRLSNESLLEVVPRRGMRVPPVSANDMREIYEILSSLESTAVQLLAERKPGEADLKRLVTATKAMQRALAQDDLDAWAAADESFHQQLVQMSGNKNHRHRDRASRELLAIFERFRLQQM